MTLGADTKLALRRIRGQASRAWLFVFCVAVGVSARVSVGSFMDSLDDALRRDARTLLTADIQISDTRAIGPKKEAQLPQLLPKGSRVQRRVSLLTMAGGLGEESRSRLVQLSAVENGYPFFGSFDIQSRGESVPMAGLFSGRKIIYAAPALLRQLKVREGDKVRLGKSEFTIAGLILKEPGLGASAFSLGPRVLVSLEHLPETGLIGFGARATHELLAALPSARLAAGAAEDLKEAWGLESKATRFRGFARMEKGVRVKTYEDAQSEIRMFFQRFATFLNLVSLMALLVGGVGVASVTRGYIADQAEAVGVYRVLGASGAVMTRVTFIQCLSLGLLGGAVGALVGSGAQVALPLLLGDWLPLKLSAQPVPSAIAWGLLLGVGVAALFSLLPVSELLATRPAELFRRGMDGARAPKGAWLLALAGAGLVVLLSGFEARSWRNGPAFVGALALGGALLWLASKALLPPLARLRGRFGGFAFRFGLSNLHRPGRRVTASVVALGLASLLLGTLLVYHRSLLTELDPRKRPQDMPGLFMIDIQDDQVEDLRAEFKNLGAEGASLSPMVKARYRGINGDQKTTSGSESDTIEAEQERYMRGREQNLSFRPDLGIGERLIEGQWFDPDSQMVEASLERWFADRLGARLGDRLLFDVQGVLIEAKVTSLREVHWASFQPNFFILLSPWALQGAPKVWISAVNGLDASARETVQDAVAKRFPNITQIDVAEGAATLMKTMGRIGWAVRFVALFSLLAGLVVLAGIALATARERRAENALLKALGGRRRDLLGAVAVEFGALGALSAALGLGLSIGLGWLVTEKLAKIPFALPAGELAGLGASLVLVTALTGIAVCWRVLAVKPLETLRDE